MIRMKKEIIYLLEYLGKSENDNAANLPKEMILALETTLLYSPSHYSQTKIQTLMRHLNYHVPETFEEALTLFDARLEAMLPSSLLAMRKTILKTLLASNFPKKKSFLEHSLTLFESQLEPVEKNIFQSIIAYVIGLNRALSLFFILGEKSTPEMLLNFAQFLHVKLLASLLHEEERVFLEKGLNELMGVYVGIYGKYLYEMKAQ